MTAIKTKLNNVQQASFFTNSVAERREAIEFINDFLVVESKNGATGSLLAYVAENLGVSTNAIKRRDLNGYSVTGYMLSTHRRAFVSVERDESDFLTSRYIRSVLRQSEIAKLMHAWASLSDNVMRLVLDDLYSTICSDGALAAA